MTELAKKDREIAELKDTVRSLTDEESPFGTLSTNRIGRARGQRTSSGIFMAVWSRTDIPDMIR